MRWNKSVSITCLLLLFAISAYAQYSSPESVVYDPVRSRYLISNAGAGSIVQRDSLGYLTNYITGLNSPKGMCIVRDTLYFTDVSVVHAYRLSTATLLYNITPATTTGLNDIDGDTTAVYFTDMSVGRIYRYNIRTHTLTTFVGSSLNTPNGVLLDHPHNRLLIVSYRTNSPIQAANLTTGAVTTITTTRYSDLDGITRDWRGYIYVSSWASNNVIMFTHDFSTSTIFSSGYSGPADIYYNVYRNEFAIPSFSDNRVLFVDGALLPNASISDTAHNWGTIAQNSAQVSWNMSIYNTGPGDLTVDSILFNSMVYSVVPSSGVINSNDSVPLTVYLNPIFPNGNDLMQIYTNDPFHPLLTVRHTANITTGSTPESGERLPAGFAIGTPYPAPFNPTVTVDISIPRVSNLSLKLYNTMGALLRAESLTALNPGNHKISVNASDLPSGMYFIQITGIPGASPVLRKAILVK